jgi:hypothetical protein
VILIAVPTLFAVFPGWAQWPVADKVRLMVAWLAVAVVGAILTAVADDRLHKQVEADQRVAIRAEHRATIRDQFRSILVPGVGGLPEQYQLTVYAPTPDRKFLIPMFPSALSTADTAIFPIEAGAVGRAWSDPTGTFVVRGDAVSDAKHGLTPAQQRRYKKFAIVATAVILGEDDQPSGVLGAIGREDDGFFDTEESVEVLKDLAEGVAWLIPAALEWMLPEEAGL